MKGTRRITLMVLTACVAVGCARGASPVAAPEFSHRAAADWINSAPLTLAGLRDKAAAGLVVAGVHTPELREERSPENVRQAVARLEQGAKTVAAAIDQLLQAKTP